MQGPAESAVALELGSVSSAVESVAPSFVASASVVALAQHMACAAAVLEAVAWAAQRVALPADPLASEAFALGAVALVASVPLLLASSSSCVQTPREIACRHDWSPTC